MRPIKFRAWDAENKKMVYDFSEPVGDKDSLLYYIVTQFDDDTIGVIPEGTADRMEVMMWTGLLDRSGKEIYEGDIVARNIKVNDIVHTTKGQIVWITESATFGMIPSSPYAFTDITVEKMSTFEIIGNIYENPELLEATK